MHDWNFKDILYPTTLLNDAVNQPLQIVKVTQSIQGIKGSERLLERKKRLNNPTKKHRRKDIPDQTKKPEKSKNRLKCDLKQTSEAQPIQGSKNGRSP